MVTILGEKLEVAELVHSTGATGSFWLHSGDKVYRCAKYEPEKMKPFEEWYRQTMPRN